MQLVQDTKFDFITLLSDFTLCFLVSNVIVKKCHFYISLLQSLKLIKTCPFKSALQPTANRVY